MSRINIELPDEILTKVKVITAIKGIKLKDYFFAAIESQVKDDDKIIEDWQIKEASQ